jgi:hypothetical protein
MEKYAPHLPSRRSHSESHRHNSLRSRVVTQVRAKLRKPSKKCKKDSSLDQVVSEASESVNPPSSCAQSTASGWTNTTATRATSIMSDVNSAQASSVYSQPDQCDVEKDMTPRRPSHDGAVAAISTSRGTLQSSSVASRLSRVFSLAPTRGTARTSVFNSPNLSRYAQSYEPSVSAQEIPTLSMHASLSVAPDSDFLHFASSDEIWVAVELSGQVFCDLAVSNVVKSVPYAAPSLAVAIVIDNSYAHP